MKLATWNVNSLTVRLPQVLDWLKQYVYNFGSHIPEVLDTYVVKTKHFEFVFYEEVCNNLFFQKL